VPMPGRVQYEYGNYVIIYLSNPAESNGQLAGRGSLIGTRRFLRSARLLPNSIEFQGRFASENACADLPFERDWPGGFICPGSAAELCCIILDFWKVRAISIVAATR
jgi:hypothetical protein